MENIALGDFHQGFSFLWHVLETFHSFSWLHSIWLYFFLPALIYPTPYFLAIPLVSNLCYYKLLKRETLHVHHCINKVFNFLWTSLIAQLVKNPPVMQESPVWFLGWEDSLEQEMATRSSILAWEILLTEESGGLQSMGSQKVRHNWALSTHTRLMLVT